MSEMVMVAMRMPLEEAQAFLKEHPEAKIFQPKKNLEQKQATLDDVLEFCRKRNSPVDGARFFKYYDGRGWIDGAGNKITNWRDKLIEWEGNGMNKPQKPVPGKTSVVVKHDPKKIADFMKWAADFCKEEEK